MASKKQTKQNRNYIKIGSRKIDIEDAFLIKEGVDRMICDWDEVVRNAIPFEDNLVVPSHICTCSFQSMIPIDYFTDNKGQVVMYGSCRNCGGYKEFVAMNLQFPIAYRDPPTMRGIVLKPSEPQTESYSDIFI